MKPLTVTLDVRNDLRQGREPFSKIMSAVSELQPEERLLLIASFEPIPLLSMLAGQGFHHESQRLHTGDWEVLLIRQSTGPAAFMPPLEPPCRAVKAEASDIVELDVRGLEPPQPMVKILEALAILPEGAELRARTERKPMHLYGQLQERGFAGQTKELTDGSHVTCIRRS